MRLTYPNAVTAVTAQEYRGLSRQIAAAAEGLAAPLVMQDRSAGVPLQRFDRNLDLSGETDSFTRLQAVLTAASEGEDRILLPKASALMVLGLAPLRVGPGGIDIEAPHRSFVLRQRDIGDPASASAAESHSWLIDIRDTVGSTCRFRGFRIEGDHDRFRRETYYYDAAHNLIFGSNCGDVIIEDMTFYAARNLTVNLRGYTALRASRNRFTRCRRDGLYLVNPSGPTWVEANRFEWIGDDIVHVLHVPAGDVQTATPPGTQDVWIVNNRSIGGRGYLLSNVRRATVAHNHGRFGSHRFVRLNAWDDNPASVDVDIHGNLCEDMIRGFEYGIGPGEVIGLNAPVASAGTRAAVPGRPAVGTGAVERPEPFFYQRQITAGAAAPHSRGIRVRNNVYRRTAILGPFVANGMGPYFRWDSDDATIAFGDTDIRPDGIVIHGSFDGLEISGNDFQTLNRAVHFNLAGAPALSLLKVAIRGNSFRDFVGGGVTTEGATAGRQQDVTFEDNAFDGDPFFLHPARAAGGRWQGDWQLTGVSTDGLTGARVARNTFRNVTRPVTDPTVLTVARLEANILFCDPVAAAAHGDNRGIRWIAPDSQAWRTVLEDSDPASAGYGQLLNLAPHAAAAMPTSGKWIQGAYVRNTDPQAAVRGWTRLTTGNAHVLGTDWLAEPAVPASLPSPDIYVPVSADADTGWLDVGAANEMVIHDTSPLTAARQVTLVGGRRAGQRVTYLCRTTGGFTRWIWDRGSSKAAAANIAAGTRVDLVWTGTAWLEVAKGAG